MPPTYETPGVYIDEQPAPKPIVGAETSITAFIGAARLGPVGMPVLISSFSEYEGQFGKLFVDYPMGYAIRDYFMHGGRKALVLRLTGNGALPARITLPGDANPADTLQLEAVNAGFWGNEIGIQIQPVRLSVSALTRRNRRGATVPRFRVIVFLEKQLVESFTDVSLVPGDPSFLPDVLLSQSRFVRVLKKNGNWALPVGSPAVTQVPIQAVGGTDGALLAASDYLGNETAQTGLNALMKADLFNLLCIPPPQRVADTDRAVYHAALKLCVDRRAMLLVDAPFSWAGETVPLNFQAETLLGLSGMETHNAAVYFPRLRQVDVLRNGVEDVFVSCGAVAGIIADNDLRRGVWKSPAGMQAELNGIKALQTNVSEAELMNMNYAGVNCLRTGTDRKTRIWGARTLRGSQSFNDEYKFIAVRRTALHIEESVLRGIGWVSFEQNDQQLWNALRLQVSNFLMMLYRAGAFQGNNPDSAFFVQCGPTTTTQQDIQNGLVHLIIGFAPLKPAEFVVIKISQRTAMN